MTAIGYDHWVINAEAPIALSVSRFENGNHMIAPLTPCHAASGKGVDGGVACRSCYEYVDDNFGDCWTVGETRGWDVYFDLLLAQGISEDQAARIVTLGFERATYKLR